MAPAKRDHTAQIRVGTSGWMYDHWHQRFYPPELPKRRWFDYYAQHFDTVEINNTFYQLPPAERFQQWAAAAPTGFLFAVKANRFLTHRKKLKDAAEPLANFIQRARRLGKHLGPILYQLPPRWKRDVQRLDQFCSLLPPRMQHVFEFRDPDWLHEDTYAVLKAHQASICVHDLIDQHPHVVTGPIVYVRFHGVGEPYGGCYSDRYLKACAKWLREQAEAGRDIFAYFNNDAYAHAVANALSLRKFLLGR